MKNKSLKSNRYFKLSVFATALISLIVHVNSADAVESIKNSLTKEGRDALAYQLRYEWRSDSYFWNVYGNGEFNSAFGENALYSNTDGDNNTATGFKALYSNTTASNNTANGTQSLYSNTTGNNNVAVGYQALYTNSTGANNAATGTNALRLNTTGHSNVANGVNALYSNTSGVGNTASGRGALFANSTGSYNTAIGYGTNVSAINLTNATAIGYNAIVNASNKVRIGNTAVTRIEGQVPWSSTSDKRLKNNIVDMPLGMDFISKLRPVEYIRNNNAEKTKEWGLIAQELQQTLKDAGYKDAGVVSEDKTPEKYMTVRYNDLLAPMIKGMQEQQKLIAAQQKAIEALQKEVALLKNKK